MIRVLKIRFSGTKVILSHDPLGHKSAILKAFEGAIESVLPSNLLRKEVELSKSGVLKFKTCKVSVDLNSVDKVLVVGAGKASGAMAEEIDNILGDRISNGRVNVLSGTSRKYKTRRIRLQDSTHPVPSEIGVRATKRMLAMLQESTPKSLVLCLISGGGSSLLPLPAEGIRLEDKVYVTKLLLKSGAGIEKVNCVRKHLSRIKGGQLPIYCGGARVISLIISDIIGNPLADVASGPTVADSSTFSEALNTLKEYKLTDSVSARVIRRLKTGAEGRIEETPKPGDRIFKRVTNVLIGDNSVACGSVVKSLSSPGRRVLYLGSSWKGEARDLGANFACLSLAIQRVTLPKCLESPCALVWGGETTVTVRGGGKGGRNQEAALSALTRIKDTDGVTMGFLATDGKDGFVDAAGALVDSSVFKRAKKRKIDLERYLSHNDSYSFFTKVRGSLLKTGPTGTNVDDLGVALVD